MRAQIRIAGKKLCVYGIFYNFTFTGIAKTESSNT